MVSELRLDNKPGCTEQGKVWAYACGPGVSLCRQGSWTYGSDSVDLHTAKYASSSASWALPSPRTQTCARRLVGLHGSKSIKAEGPRLNRPYIPQALLGRRLDPHPDARSLRGGSRVAAAKVIVSSHNSHSLDIISPQEYLGKLLRLLGIEIT